jgi:hypothetical protein
MRAWGVRWRRLGRVREWAAGAAARIGVAGRALAGRLAYRPREVVVVAVLAGGLLGGLGVEQWRRAHRALAERLEAEPPPVLTPTPPRAGTERSRARGATAQRPARGRGRQGEALRAGRGLDLNRVTAAELARVAGISWRAAQRVVATRDAFGPDRPGPRRPRGDRRGGAWRERGGGREGVTPARRPGPSDGPPGDRRELAPAAAAPSPAALEEAGDGLCAPSRVPAPGEAPEPVSTTGDPRAGCAAPGSPRR